ncbi:hypothetical protein COO72_12440 [Bifidobacterium callitrichos]|nr:hypothetical protein COO72_12440 [Bifidobacterium callitrichos]
MTGTLEHTLDVSEATFDLIVSRIIDMDDDTSGGYAQVTFTTFGQSAHCGMFALAIEPDDTDTLIRFLTDECGETAWDAHMDAERFTELWNQGRYSQAAHLFDTVCHVTLAATIPLASRPGEALR